MKPFSVEVLKVVKTDKEKQEKGKSGKETGTVFAVTVEGINGVDCRGTIKFPEKCDVKPGDVLGVKVQTKQGTLE
jgi:hypothetical protein